MTLNQSSNRGILVKPPLRWMGGKSKLADFIIAKFPDHHCYVEPFCGGAAVFFAKPLSRVEVINDINDDLVNFYRCLQHHPDELLRIINYYFHSRSVFQNCKKNIAQTDLQRAANFYAINRMSFGAKMSGSTFGYARTSKPGFSLQRFRRDVAALSARLDGVFVENLAWDDVVRRYDGERTLFYCDPPYHETAGYGCSFDFSEYEKMAALAGFIKGKMMVSINDHPDIRQVFNGFGFDQLSIKYALGAASNESKVKVSSELLIYNF